MDNSVKQRLLGLSADFYHFHADSFEETRQNAWDSWQRIVTETQQLNAPRDLLDLGCGNGRFATFLRKNGHAAISYTGIDSEAQLIHKARQVHPDERFYVDNIESALRSEIKFDFVVCVGVLHHVPDHHDRSDMLARFLHVLRPGGVAAVSLWQPKLLKNFDTKICISHDISGLERNDFLLGWKGDFSHLRYCHHFDDDEIEQLAAQSRLELVEQFQGTGNDQSNRYLLLQNASGRGRGREHQ